MRRCLMPDHLLPHCPMWGGPPRPQPAPRPAQAGRARPARTIRSAIILGILLTLGVRAEVLDRIAVTVGKQVIAESEVVNDVRISAFLDRKPLVLSSDVKRKAAERLVDQVLILREATESRVALPGDAEAARLLAQVKSQYTSEAEYQSALVEYNITEAELSAHLLAGLRTLSFTELRFRPEIQVSDDDLREFYQLFAAGMKRPDTGQPPTFEESRDQVQKLLVDQKVIEALDAWLSSTRTQVGVEYRDKVFP